MAELVVVGFNNVTEPDHALMELTRLHNEHAIDLQDSVVAVRQPDGKVNLNQSSNLVGIGSASGGLSGAFWGTVVGLLTASDDVETTGVLMSGDVHEAFGIGLIALGSVLCCACLAMLLVPQ